VDARESERVREEKDRRHSPALSANLLLEISDLVRYHVEAVLSRVDADALVFQLADHPRQI
jgi:hypothetical protein